ncbi:trehalase [Manduca sexta]|uniref:Trehalase n=1 Tax=Manduca sexta TaxID=7130 RepID=A0A922CHJ6_MANSE|nr:trehalase [Manduca sexta]KAG6447080.1 hypothetical protein O3G_MSEX004750 [Manduca sexta]
MRLLILVVAITAVVADDLPPSCSKPVYCNSELLHHVQMARLYDDSKTFVDLQMRQNENITLAAFQELLNRTNNNPSRDQIRQFVNEYFDETSELENWTPPDITENPKFLTKVRDEKLRQFGKDIVGIWPTLARKVRSIVLEKPDQFSFVPVTHGFIIPGGRFREIYYWDTYWIVEGLLISDMKETARGMIENLIELLRKIGHIPNGSRWYYQERSQPPLLSAMMALYFKYTKDIQFLRDNIQYLEKEMNYWLDTHIISISKDGETFTLLRYYSPSAGPRPESYREDYENAHTLDSNNTNHNEFYADIKSAAESGWDFSTRWFLTPEGDNKGNLSQISTRNIIPVDLNAIFANAVQNTANFLGILKKPRRAAHWASIARQWRSNIEKVLWNDEDGIWYDYDIVNGKHRQYFYPSNVAPFWMKAVDRELSKKHAPRVIDYLQESKGLSFPGGVPSSLVRSGEQWDFPNVWPPAVGIVIGALEGMGTIEGNRLAKEVCQVWVWATHKGFSKNKQMFEKYDAEVPGRFGGGGEYVVQEGFGWANGLVLECLAKYGPALKSYDELENNSSSEASSDSDMENTSVE